MTPPLHSCGRALCPCPKTVAVPDNVAARIAATMAVAGLAAWPALDLFADSGGSGGAAGSGGGAGGSAGGRRLYAVCSACPGAAALTRTTLIVTGALALLAVVALSVRFCTAGTAPPSAPLQLLAPRPRPPPLPPPPADTATATTARVIAPAEAAAPDEPAAAALRTPSSGAMEAPPEGLTAVSEVEDTPLKITASEAGAAHGEAIVEDLMSPDDADAVRDDRSIAVDSGQEDGSDLSFMTDDLDPGVDVDSLLPADDVTSTTETAAAGFEASNGEHEPTAEATDSVPVQTDHDGDHHDGGEQRRRGPPGNKPAGWRPLPRTPSTRRPFRPRQDHGGPPPAWKQFEGVALHVRPAAAHAPHAAAAHKRHVVLPTSTAFTPLHVFPAGAAGWQQLQQRTHFPAVGAPLWGMHVQAPPPQHVWSPAGPQGGSWGAQQVRMQQVAYGTPMGAPLPCHLCPPMGPTGQMAARMAPPLLHLAVGAAGPSPPAQRPRSPVAGPAWTC